MSDRRFLRIDPALIHDGAGGGAAGATAIYWLADPRDVRGARYVGQTRDPRRRFAVACTRATEQTVLVVPAGATATRLLAEIRLPSSPHRPRSPGR